MLLKASASGLVLRVIRRTFSSTSSVGLRVVGVVTPTQASDSETSDRYPVFHVGLP